MVGVEMPPPHEFLSDEQKSGQELVANEIQITSSNLSKFLLLFRKSGLIKC